MNVTDPDESTAKPANREWYVGYNNFAEAGTPDRWVAYENAWVAMRSALGFGKLTLLPFAPPTDEANAVLVGEMNPPDGRVAYAQGGERYYGFMYALEADGLPNVHSQAQLDQATAPSGYGSPLFADGVEELYAGALGISFQPDLHEPVPWERTGLYQ